MLVPKIEVVLKDNICVLNQYSSVRFPINISKGAEGKTTGKIGVCILPSKALHFAVEVMLEKMNPPNIMLPLNILEAVIPKAQVK